MGIEINLRVITKNLEADQEKGLRTKAISKPYSRATAKPSNCVFKALSYYCSHLLTTVIC